MKAQKVNHGLIQPGSIVTVDGDALGFDGHVSVRAVATRVNPVRRRISVRSRRCPTQAEIERGDYDPWVKSAKTVPFDAIQGVEPCPSKDAVGGAGIAT